MLFERQLQDPINYLSWIFQELKNMAGITKVTQNAHGDIATDIDQTLPMP